MVTNGKKYIKRSDTGDIDRVLVYAKVTLLLNVHSLDRLEVDLCNPHNKFLTLLSKF